MAARAGVSVSTVSHVLNETRPVRPATRNAVLAAVRDTGYVPNTIARSLVTSRTLTVGVAISAISNPYFTEVVQGIQAEAERHGYTLLLADTHDDTAREHRVARELYKRRVDGVLLAPSADPTDALRYLRRHAIPVVLVDRMLGRAFDEVGAENAEATAQLTQHLADAGHRRIALVAGRPGLATTRERIEGYRLGLQRSELRFESRLMISGGSDAAGGDEAVRRLLSLTAPPTALVIGNNHMTIGAMRALHNAGLAVPRDIALVAFDDFEWADLFSPRLTTIAQPCTELGAEAMRLLLTRLLDPAQPARSVRLSSRFVHRDSCGCSAAATLPPSPLSATW